MAFLRRSWKDLAQVKVTGARKEKVCGGMSNSRGIQRKESTEVSGRTIQFVQGLVSGFGDE